MAYKIYRKGRLFYIVDTTNNRKYSGLIRDVLVTRRTTEANDFFILGVKEWNKDKGINISEIRDENGQSYTVSAFKTFFERSNSQGEQ